MFNNKTKQNKTNTHTHSGEKKKKQEKKMTQKATFCLKEALLRKDVQPRWKELPLESIWESRKADASPPADLLRMPSLREATKCLCGSRTKAEAPEETLIFHLTRRSASPRSTDCPWDSRQGRCHCQRTGLPKEPSPPRSHRKLQRTVWTLYSLEK